MFEEFRIVRTKLGYVGMVASPRGLCRIYLPERSADALRRRIRRDLPDIREDGRLLPELADTLRRYFAGERVEFDVRLDCGDAADFRADVWQACLRVGYGKTVSYGELARRAGRPGAARAVGTAMSHNPFPIVVPCHRVVKSDGSLGGYSGPQGVAFKRRLLEMEAAVCGGH
jgi:methylated-DNA-[protein]-cysteine S-methyltransferase